LLFTLASDKKNKNKKNHHHPFFIFLGLRDGGGNLCGSLCIIYGRLLESSNLVCWNPAILFAGIQQTVDIVVFFVYKVVGRGFF
jgi:hypothetical protein